MAAYNSNPGSTANYDRRGPIQDSNTSNHEMLTQQQQQQPQQRQQQQPQQRQQQQPQQRQQQQPQQRQQHHGIPPPQPYQFDPYQHDRQPTYAGHADGQGEDQLHLGADGSEKQRWKGNRLRKACDSCSIRKVRCDESGPPCLACSALEIPCTFERPSRRRGPPNRHAEAIKRRRNEPPSSPGSFSSPRSPNNVAATLASFSSHAVLSAESICPFPMLELLVDDFFTYIHPLVPFPHEPSFRAAFKHREDLNNPSFLALLAAMVGALVASFPRRPKLHLKNQRRESMFPSSMSLVERCRKVAVEARGPGYLDKDMTVYDAATSYLLALVGAYTLNFRHCRLYFGETLTILRVLGAHKVNNPGQNMSLSTYDVPLRGAHAGEPVDFIRQEIGRRIFWCLFVGIRSMQQLGASVCELVIPPPTPSEPYPPLPMEVDDQYIYVSHVDSQPQGIISELVGFNLGCKVYMTCTPLSTMELAYGIDHIFDWNRQKRVLEECLRNVKTTLDTAPRELLLAPGSQPGEFEGQNNRLYASALQSFSDAAGVLGEGIPPTEADLQNESRRFLQYEIQKANIYASQLGTRSYIVEKYWNLLDAHESRKNGRDSNGTSPSSQGSPDVMAKGLDGMLRNNGASSECEVVENYMGIERETIVKDLLTVLRSISQVNMEPNGGSFIYKIRQIASTLLDTPRNRKGPLAIKAEEYLAHFLDILMRLERVPPSPSSVQECLREDGYMEAREEELEEEELRNWADFREYQMRFAANGGFLTEF